MKNVRKPDPKSVTSADDDRRPIDAGRQPESMEAADIANGEGDPEIDTT